MNRTFIFIIRFPLKSLLALRSVCQHLHYIRWLIGSLTSLYLSVGRSVSWSAGWLAGRLFHKTAWSYTSVLPVFFLTKRFAAKMFFCVPKYIFCSYILDVRNLPMNPHFLLLVGPTWFPNIKKSREIVLATLSQDICTAIWILQFCNFKR